MFKKYLLITFLLISPIFLSGCNNQESKNPSDILGNEQEKITENEEKSTSTEKNTLITTEIKKEIIECPDCKYCKIEKQKEIEIFETDNKFLICEDCSFDNDCKTGYICNNNICISKKTIEVKPDCQVDENSIGNCEHIDCVGCKTKTAKCVNSLEDWNNNKCIDCNSDYDCSENYVCRNFTCLKISDEFLNIKKTISSTDKNGKEKILKTTIPYYDDSKENIYDSDIYEENDNSFTNITDETINTYFCGNMDCFEDKFSKCNSRITFEDDNKLKNVRYEIIGYESGQCKIKIEYLKYPNSELENKSMVCLFDNSKSFEDAEYEVLNNIKTSKCKGELADLLKMF